MQSVYVLLGAVACVAHVAEHTCNSDGAYDIMLHLASVELHTGVHATC
jgi:hypothetical protein